MNRSFERTEEMMYPTSTEGRFVPEYHHHSGNNHPHHHHHHRSPYPPHPHEYHTMTPPQSALPADPYGMAYHGYETNGYDGPPSSFDSNGSPHHSTSGPVPPPPPHRYMPPYPPYFPPWSVMPAPPLIGDITPSDVLCGRGGATNSHSGNRAFRLLVKEHKEQYLRAKKRDKPTVASIIVELIRKKGGRFLRRYDTDHTGQVRWVDIGDDRAREKTCQALRENAPELRRRKVVPSSSEETDEQKPSKRIRLHSPMRTPVPSSHASSNTPKSLPTPELPTPEITFVHRSTDEDSTPPRNEDGPIMVRPYARLLPGDVSIEPIPLDHLSPQDRALYLQDFLPPCPILRPKQSTSDSHSSSLPWPVFSI